MVRRCSVDGRGRKRPIEGDEASTAGRRKGEQVRIGDLARPKQTEPVNDPRVEDAHVTRPGLVMFALARLSQEFDRLSSWDRAWVARLASDAHNAVLGNWARRPAGPNLKVKPFGGPSVVDVVAVE